MTLFLIVLLDRKKQKATIRGPPKPTKVVADQLYTMRDYMHVRIMWYVYPTIAFPYVEHNYVCGN